MYITKQQAIDTLYILTDSGILDSELKDNIASLLDVLRNEVIYGLVLWGAKDEVENLITAKRQAKHCEELEKKYSLEGRIYNALLHADAGLKTHDLARLIAEKVVAEPGVDNAD